jgi:hypothetical protein
MKTKETGPLDGSAGKAADNGANSVHGLQITRWCRRAKVCLVSKRTTGIAKSLRSTHTAD